MKPVDILLVNYKSAGSLKKCLASIYRYLPHLPVEIYVYDNGNDPGMAGVMDAFPGVHLTTNRRNIGFGAAANRLMRRGGSPFILLLNPDAYLEDDTLVRAVDYLSSHRRIGILGPRIVDDDGSVQGSARAFPSVFTGMFGRTSVLTRLFPNNRYSRQNILTHRSAAGRPVAVDWVSGACMLVRRAAIETVGLFDEQFFMYWEDADWCRRMREGKWKVVYFPEASVRHSVGASSRMRPLRSSVDFHKSAYLLFMKYHRNANAWVRLGVFSALVLRFYLRLMVDGGKALRGVLSGSQRAEGVPPGGASRCTRAGKEKNRTIARRRSGLRRTRSREA